MCGLAGIVSTTLDRAMVQRMGDSLRHRGPDDEGLWCDPEAGVGLAHRRLSIIDLSAAGHQPMESADGRFVLIYNGEIYNHAALRSELEAAGGGPGGNGWHGHSDTETLLAAIAHWGLATALAKSVGMFALALWDRKERRLQLARDRFGEKPLYYGWVGSDFLFGSELMALRTHPRFANEVDRGALWLLASRSYIPAPLSIFRRIYKLEPGCILTAEAKALAIPLDTPPRPDAGGAVAVQRYWSYRQVLQDGLADPIQDEGEAIERLEAALAEAIQGQSIADVPLGAFLSGGFDSSTVVALYQKHSSRPVHTYSIGFAEAAYDEAPFAREVARHFGTDHHEHYVGAREALDVIPRLPEIYDEPFADSSQIPTFLISRFAREQVTVALSGDGGDELFGGYNRYATVARTWQRMAALPGPVRSAFGGALGAVPPSLWNGLGRLLPGKKRPPHLGTKVQKGFRTMARAGSLDEVFTAFLDEWWGEPSPVRDGSASFALGCFDLDPGVPASDAVRMMYADTLSYLPDDILCKVDRAAMAVSLETRVPFLDHRVAALAARIPIGMKIQRGKGKAIVRKLLYRYAPQELFERPKTGFSIPLADWLRGPLRPWAEELLGPRLEQDGFFDAAAVRRRWQAHLTGERDGAAALWAVLMFQAWRTNLVAEP
jgi:asparagine synthase (glutamine-hydrolysing)